MTDFAASLWRDALAIRVAQLAPRGETRRGVIEFLSFVPEGRYLRWFVRVERERIDVLHEAPSLPSAVVRMPDATYADLLMGASVPRLNVYGDVQLVSEFFGALAAQQEPTTLTALRSAR